MKKSVILSLLFASQSVFASQTSSISASVASAATVIECGTDVFVEQKSSGFHAAGTMSEYGDQISVVRGGYEALLMIDGKNKVGSYLKDLNLGIAVYSAPVVVEANQYAQILNYSKGSDPNRSFIISCKVK